MIKVEKPMSPYDVTIRFTPEQISELKEVVMPDGTVLHKVPFLFERLGNSDYFRVKV